MSEQSVKIVRDVYDSFAAGDVDAVFAAMTPDIEWDESEGMPYCGVYHGRDTIVSSVFGPILADVEGFTAAPDEILPLDNTRVVALGTHGGQGANGPVRARFVHIWTVTNGLVSRYQDSPTPTPLEPPSASSYTNRAERESRRQHQISRFPCCDNAIPLPRTCVSVQHEPSCRCARHRADPVRWAAEPAGDVGSAGPS